MSKVKIGIITYFTEDYNLMGNISLKNKLAFCEDKENIEVVFAQDKLSGKFVKKSFEKFYILLKYLKNYDWLMWSDCDLLLMNPKWDITTLLSSEKNAIFSLFFSSQSNQTYLLHAGTFMIKNCSWSFDFLEKCDKLSQYVDWTQNPMVEEEVLTKFYKNPKYSPLIKIVSYKTFSSMFHLPNSRMPKQNLYEIGDNILHYSYPLTKQEKTIAMCNFEQHTLEIFGKYIPDASLNANDHSEYLKKINAMEKII